MASARFYSELTTAHCPDDYAAIASVFLSGPIMINNTYPGGLNRNLSRDSRDIIGEVH